MKKINRDICEGPLLKSLVRYIVPLMLTNLIQVFYNTADTIVVGMFCGSAALAAVGAAGSIVSFLSTFIIGLSTGVGVCVSQAVGAKDYDKLKRTIYTALVIAFVGGLLVFLFGLLFSKSLLVVTDTPKEILGDTTTYLYCCFCAYPLFIPAVFINSILLSQGETKKPMIFSLATGSTNIILNLLFTGVFEMGVFGVALSTAISQIFSFVLNFWALFGKHSDMRFDWKQPKFDVNVLKGILLLGLPTGIQNSVVTLSNLVIRATYNSFGIAFLSGYTAAQNVFGIVSMVFGAFGQAASVFSGQNYGAGKFVRIKKALLACVSGTALAGLLFGTVTALFGSELLSLYINDSKEALGYGLLTFSIFGFPSLFTGICACISGATRGMGVSMPQLFVSLGGAVGLKLLWIYTVFRLPSFNSPQGLLLADPIIWVLQCVASALIFVLVYKKRSSQKTI